MTTFSPSSVQLLVKASSKVVTLRDPIVIVEKTKGPVKIQEMQMKVWGVVEARLSDEFARLVW